MIGRHSQHEHLRDAQELVRGRDEDGVLEPTLAHAQSRPGQRGAVEAEDYVASNRLPLLRRRAGGLLYPYPSFGDLRVDGLGGASEKAFVAAEAPDDLQDHAKQQET